ncbi:MAG: ATP-binding protein [Desulfobacterales bacterium]
MHRILLYSLLLIGVTAFCGCTAENPRPVARAGCLDLSGWDFSRGRVVYLDGEWDFYWKRLVAPADAAGAPDGGFHLPDYWNGHRLAGRALGGDGWATFRLRIALPPGQPDLALRIEDQSTAYRLWINATEVMANGRVGADAASTTPDYQVRTASLPTHAGTLDCLLQVANFHATRGGPYRKIALGSRTAIDELHVRRFAIDVLLFSVLGIIGLYHLVFFLLRPNDRSPLYFGGFCLCWCLSTAFGGTGGRFITLIFPDLPWYWLCRTDILGWFASVPLATMFFAALYPDEFSTLVTRLVQITAVLFILYGFLAPSRLLGWIEIPYQIFSMATALYIVSALCRSLRRGRSGAALILAGFLVFVATVVNDILFMNMVVYSVYLISAGMLAMVLSQSFVLSRRFARSFAMVESLTAELAGKNITLSRLDTLKDEFLANTSHELRTPLNGIVGLAESLVAGATGALPEKTRRSLGMIAASGRRLGALINDIVDMSRLRNHELALRRQPVDTRALTETVLAVMRPLAQGKSLALLNEIPDGLPALLGDEDRLQQILYNLVGNAIKFTDRGTVRITACAMDGTVEMTVADTGIGIPLEHQERIFHPFEQADASETRVFGGAGLGLAITRQLVELHGGGISVASAPGAGSRFRIRLPAAPAGVVEVPRTATASPVVATAAPEVLVSAAEPTELLAGIAGHVTILAVDDDPVNLQVIVNSLAYRNVTVRTAGDGRYALEIIGMDPLPDLVLLDIMMPRVNGYDVCRKVRQSYPPQVLPVILLTARIGAQDLAQGFAEGANDYLAKPFAKEELTARVVSQLQLKQAYVTLRENLSLRRELEERKRSERQLRLMQRRLSFMLDSIEDALLAVNESGEVAFCNQRCEALLGCGAEALLGRPFRTLLRQEAREKGSAAGGESLRSYIDGPDRLQPVEVDLVKSDGTACPVRIFPSCFEVEEDAVCLLILRRAASPNESGSAPDLPQSLAAVEAIRRNRARLQSLKTTLDGLLPFIHHEQSGFLEELVAIDTALEHIGAALLQGERHQTRRHLAVEVMTCALDYWTQCTGLSKADLATQSKLWKTYTNQDGWERTQTLDRYLAIESFPQRPAWLKIFKTAEYVLAAGTVDSALRARLEALLTRLRVRK